jgi:SAM-dependent methyltransferase
MENFWDIKFDQEDWLYGTNPNDFFKEHLLRMKPGLVLLPGEGEGRNANFAAQNGWNVWAFDTSIVGKNKALSLVGNSQLSIRYDIVSVEAFHPGESGFDAIGLIYTHFMPDTRHSFFKKLQEWLNPGGKIILEAFRKDQIHRTTGGPKNLDMLYSLDEIGRDFGQLYPEFLSAETVILNEGTGHVGEADVVRYVGVKK